MEYIKTKATFFIFLSILTIVGSLTYGKSIFYDDTNLSSLNAKIIEDSKNHTTEKELEQYPISASADSGNIGSLLLNNERDYRCSLDLLNSSWKKRTEMESGKLVLIFEKEVYPKKLIVYGIDPWFTKLESWNGSEWIVIWMGESSNCITEMNVRETNFKSKKYRITSPFGKFGGVYAVKLVGSEIKQSFPSCRDIGKMCNIGYVCTSSWKNSNDTSMCCSQECELRIFAYAFDNVFLGSSSLDIVRIANKLNMNYYKMSRGRWYVHETNDETHEIQEVIDFYEKTKNSNINLFIGFYRDTSFLSQYNEQKVLFDYYPKLKGIYIDDASNRGYEYIYKEIKNLNSIDQELNYILVGYNKHLINWGKELRNKFGSETIVGKKVFWTIFGDSIPCLVSTPNFKDIEKLNSIGPANKIGIGLYVGSYTSWYCNVLRKIRNKGWEPHDINAQKKFWKEGIRAGFGGMFFWNPWMFSKNGRDKEYYEGEIYLRIHPTAKERQWAYPGIKVTDQIDLAHQLIPDLCPYCNFCSENKIYSEDGHFGASCCEIDEEAIGNICIKKKSDKIWSINSSVGRIYGKPSQNFNCNLYKNATKDMYKLSSNENIIFYFEKNITPTHLIIYGNNLFISKIELYKHNSSSWEEIYKEEFLLPRCIISIKINKNNSTNTDKVRISFLQRTENQYIDAVQIAEEKETNMLKKNKTCTIDDWDYTLSFCDDNNKQIKKWFKITNCSDGIRKTDEVIDCIRENLNGEDNDGDGIPNEEDLCQNTIRQDFKINKKGCPLPYIKEYNFSNLDNENLKKINNFRIYTKYSEIIFNEPISLIRNNMPLQVSFPNIVLEKNKIYLDSSLFPELNKSATLIFKNLTIKEPIVLKDRKLCEECKLYKFDDEIFVEIQHFTTYEIIEKEEYLNLLKNKSNETNVSFCIPVWKCDYLGECINGKKKGFCYDTKNCSINSTKEVEANCIFLKNVEIERNIAQECIPLWQCESLKEEDCLEKGFIEIKCIDVNKCGKNETNPSRIVKCSQEKRKKEKKTPKTFFGYFLLLTLLLIAITVIYFIKKNKSLKQ